jgi:4-amino-4-deoxy-L-arabinose transferase-like glycosyltransferase
MLGKYPFENWDEAWYADITREMMRRNELFVLFWNNEMLLDKPPMFIWITSLFSILFGLSEFSVRLPSALSGLAIILTVLIYSYKKFGLFPALLGFSSLVLNNILVWRLRSGNIDLFLSLLIFITYFLILSKHKRKYIWLGIIFGCIYLTKLSIVLFPFSIFVIYEFLYERKNIRRNFKEYIKIMSIFFLLSGGWLLLGYLKVGKVFTDYYLFYSDQGVGSVDFSKFNFNYISYAYYSLQRRFFPVMILGTCAALLNLRKRENFLLFMFGWLLLFQLSFTEKNNNWYLIPSMPFWALLVAVGTNSFINIVRKNVLIITCVVLVSSYVSYKTFTVNIIPILSNSSTVKQAESSAFLKTVTQKDDTVVRLDHLYPVTIYYSDRRVLASPDGTVDTKKYWIQRSDLIGHIEKNTLKWLIGTTKDIERFKSENHQFTFKTISVNDEESIVEVIKVGN